MSQNVNPVDPHHPVDGQSTAELVQHASEQITRLVREEVALARLELAEKGRHAGIGAGLLGGGGLLALYGLGVLIIVAVLALAEAMPAWLAALIVAVALLLVAGGMALYGRRQVRQATPAMPAGTAQSVRADLDTVTAAVRDRGSTEPREPATAPRGPATAPRGPATAPRDRGTTPPREPAGEPASRSTQERVAMIERELASRAPLGRLRGRERAGVAATPGGAGADVRRPDSSRRPGGLRWPGSGAAARESGEGRGRPGPEREPAVRGPGAAREPRSRQRAAGGRT